MLDVINKGRGPNSGGGGGGVGFGLTLCWYNGYQNSNKKTCRGIGIKAYPYNSPFIAIIL
jgi:hypothetical protein